MPGYSAGPPGGGAADGMPADEQMKRPLREPSGHVPSASNASTNWIGGHEGTQPHTLGTSSPRAGATP